MVIEHNKVWLWFLLPDLRFKNVILSWTFGVFFLEFKNLSNDSENVWRVFSAASAFLPEQS